MDLTLGSTSVLSPNLLFICVTIKHIYSLSDTRSPKVSPQPSFKHGIRGAASYPGQVQHPKE